MPAECDHSSKYNGNMRDSEGSSRQQAACHTKGEQSVASQCAHVMLSNVLVYAHLHGQNRRRHAPSYEVHFSCLPIAARN